MPYISFEEQAIKNVLNEVNKEYFVTNSIGAYSSSTVTNLNTRKYHGVFVVPQSHLGNENHVMLSSFDEAVNLGNQKYDLSMHQYPGTLVPEKNQFLHNFQLDPNPTWIYRNENFEIEKTLFFVPGKPQLLISYKLLKGNEELSLQFTPFLAFRNLHHLRQGNDKINRTIFNSEQGICFKPYEEYDRLFIQFSIIPDFHAIDDWYFNIEYDEEKSRGYDFKEDLFVPGILTTRIGMSDQLIVSIGTQEFSNPKQLGSFFQKLKKEFKKISTYEDCLASASRQFVIRRKGSLSVVAGWHWFGTWGRDTFIALPGLFLASKDLEEVKNILSGFIRNIKGGLFPNVVGDSESAYNSVDAPLWFCWAVQKIKEYAPGDFSAWELYGKVIQEILTSFRDGTLYGIHMNQDGLISSGEPGKALTWMDAVVKGEAVTPRSGMPVEVNALWFNAVNFAIELAAEAGEKAFVEEWKNLPVLIKNSFQRTFWNEEKKYLADVVTGDHQDFSIRPNMIFAVSLPYSPVTQEMATSIIKIAKRELLTPRGLKTLAKGDPAFKGKCYGDQETRDRAYHQGTVWPWLFGHFAEALIKVDPQNGINKVSANCLAFEETLLEHGIGTISEIFDGEEPYTPRGTISQAWSVSELIRTQYLLKTSLE